MPNASGQETKAKEQESNHIGSPKKNENTVEGKKKKRNRCRNRIRNKNYKPAAANVVQEPAIESIELHLDLQKEQQKPQHIAQPLTNTTSEIRNCPVENCLLEKQQIKEKLVAPMNSLAPQKPAAATPPTVVGGSALAKTREQIIAEREAKKQAKQAKKTKIVSDTTSTAAPDVNCAATTPAAVVTKPIVTNSVPTNLQPNNVIQVPAGGDEKTRDQIKAEREAKKLAKQANKVAKTENAAAVTEVIKEMANVKIVPTTAQIPAPTSANPDEKKKPALTKAERRAIQEAQRAAKTQTQKIAPAKAVANNSAVPRTARSTTIAVTPEKQKVGTPLKSTASPATKAVKSNDCKVKLFNHLESAHKNVSLFVNNSQIHPSMARLGEQYAKRTVVGSNARCIAFLNALKMVIKDFQTPPKKEFGRSLEASIKNCVEHLQKCRPLAVSVTNAYKHIKHVLTQLPADTPESELKENLCHFIDTYVENQIGKAAQAISSSMQEKISDGDVILTFGCSSLINFICEEAHRRHVNFRVIVVDSRPFCEGQELLRRLTVKEIPCTYVLINAVGFVMPEATKVLLGAHALLSNGYVMARTGTAQVALVARSFNVPVLVCCETHKFSERFQTDAIVYNELGNPDDLIRNDKCCLANWQAKSKMSPLNLLYDITPPELVTAVVTEVSILPCTSVPVILRIKPTEIGYYS